MARKKPDKSTQPHHRLTVKAVVQDFKAGLITAKGAIFYAVAASRRLGEPVRFRPAILYNRLGISKTSFYRAVSELKLQKRIDWVVQGEIDLWIPVRETEEKSMVPEYIFLEELSQKWDNESQIRENESQKWDGESQKWDGESQKWDGESQKWDKKTPEPSSDNGSGTPLSIQSLNNLSLSTANGEREVQKKGYTVAAEYHDWLARKASRLPTPPALLEQWIEAQARKAANIKEFQQYQESLKKAQSPEILQSEQNQQPSIPDTPEGKLQHYQRLWEIPALRASIQQSINAHPEWGLLVDADGVKLAPEPATGEGQIAPELADG